MKKILKNSGLGLCAALAVFGMTGCASNGQHRSTGEAIDDASIHTKVKAALINDPVITGKAIDVSVNRGEVTLTGAVNGEAEHQKAVDTAKGINGVKAVVDKIVVRDVPAPK